LTLDVAGDRAAGRFDLARGDPLGLHGLEAIGAEVQRGAALGVAVNPALERLAELHLLRLQHCSYSAPEDQRAGRTPEVCASIISRSCAIGSWAKISPLKIQHLMPITP